MSEMDDVMTTEEIEETNLGTDDDYDEIEEITEYDEDEDDEEYDEDEEYEEDEDEDDEEYEEEDDEEYDEDEDEDEEYEEEEDDGEYEDKFGQILEELKNLNSNLTKSSGTSTDPYLAGEVSRMRDDVMKTGIQQGVQQNNALFSEISKLRDDMSKNANQTMQMELMKLRDDVNLNGGAGGAARGGVYDMFLQTELAKLREEMTRTSMSGVSQEVQRLREELSSRTLKDEMGKEIEDLRRQMRDKEQEEKLRAAAREEMRKSSGPSDELAEVRSQMSRLRQEMTEALEGRQSRVRAYGRRYDNEYDDPDAREHAMNVLDEIKKLREEVAKSQEKNAEELSKKIESVDKKTELSDRRNREILNAIGKMMVSSNRELKGITGKNKAIADSFQESMKESLKELESVKGEVSKIKINPACDFEDIARRSNREVVSEIGVQLGALAKDIISKVDNRDRQTELYEQLADIRDEVARSNKELAGGLSGRIDGIAKEISSKVDSRERQEELLKEISSIRSEIMKNSDTAGARSQKQEDMLKNISELVTKNQNVTNSILAAARKNMELAAQGNRVTANQLAQLKETVKNVAVKELSELTDLKKVLVKLAGTSEQITEIDKKIMSVGTELNKAVDVMSADIKKNITDMMSYSNADKILDTIKREINAATTEALNYSFRNIKADIRKEVSGTVAESGSVLINHLDERETKLIKAIDSVRLDGIDRMISEIKTAVAENGLADKENFKTVAEKLDAQAETGAMLRREVSNISKEIAKASEKSTQLLSAIAKRMIKEFEDNKQISARTLSAVKADIKGVYEGGVKQIAMVRDEILATNPKADIISYVGEKLDTVSDGIDSVMRDLTGRVLEAVSSNADAEMITGCLDKVAAEIKRDFASALSENIGEVTATVDAMSDTLTESVDRINTAFSGNIERVNDMFGENIAKVVDGFDKGIGRVNEAVDKFSGAMRSSTEGMQSLLSGIAKRMIKEFEENKQVSARAFAAVKKDIETAYQAVINDFNEYKKAMMGLDKDGELTDIISIKLDKLAGRIQSGIEKIKEEIIFNVGSKEEIAKLSEVLDRMGKDIKSDLMAGINSNAAAADSLAEQLSALAEIVHRNSEKQLDAVMNLVGEKVDALLEEVKPVRGEISRGLSVAESNIISSIGDKFNDKLTRQEQNLLSLLGEQIKEIRTSLVDVIGQNDIIENIAKNVRDVKSELGGELRQLDNSELIQELISQINLLSEYMLAGGKQSTDDKKEFFDKIGELRADIENISFEKDIESVRRDLAGLRELIEDGKASDSVMVSLIEQVNAIDENLRYLQTGENSDQIMDRLRELADRIGKMNEAVTDLRNKEIEMPELSDEARIRAAKIMAEKLTEIKEALLAAVANGANRNDVISFANALGRIGDELSGGSEKR